MPEVSEPKTITISESTWERLERIRELSDFTISMDAVINGILDSRRAD